MSGSALGSKTRQGSAINYCEAAFLLCVNVLGLTTQEKNSLMTKSPISRARIRLPSFVMCLPSVIERRNRRGKPAAKSKSGVSELSSAIAACHARCAGQAQRCTHRLPQRGRSKSVASVTNVTSNTSTSCLFATAIILSKISFKMSWRVAFRHFHGGNCRQKRHSGIRIPGCPLIAGMRLRCALVDAGLLRCQSSAVCGFS